MSSLFAFLHHAAAFALVSSLVLESVLIREALSVSIARRLQAADLAFGISAGLVLAVGLVRVFFLEKGASYYFHNVPFLVKLSLFIVIGILSIYPTREFLSWRTSTRAGRAPVVDEGRLRALRMIIHFELAAGGVLIFCAALMARGVGSLP